MRGIPAASSSGVWALILASMLWGTTGTAASFLPDSVSPLAVGASTMTIGGLLLFAVSARPSLAAVRASSSRRWVLIGAVGVFVYPLAFYSSMSLAGVAIGNVVSLGTGPVFAALLEWIVERRRLTLRWALCTAVAIQGVILLALGSHRDDAPQATSPLLGIGLGVAAGLAYALYTYASSRAIGTGQPSRAVMGSMFGLGAIALLPVLLVFGAPLLQSTTTVGIAAYLALGPMFVAYLLFGVGMRTLRSSTATTITLLEPVVATILAVLVVGERLELLGWAGLILILGAVTVLATARQPRSPGQSP
ncbi:MAG TPA: EamA family transporter [Rhodoglobus sp.]|nr:EamA family transporter [Rhodoglobus sp.]